MKKHFFVGILCLIASSASAEPACVRDIELNFYQTNLLNETLSSHSISQSNWVLINYELSSRVKDVPSRVRKRAEKMSPNPFDEPYQSLVVQDLVEKALLEVLRDTLLIFNITNPGYAEDMFKYIRDRQQQRFLNCFGEKPKEKKN